jgi:hypothetical protein
MVMYRFEIHGEEERPDKGIRYRWELLRSDGGDRAEVVAEGQRLSSRAEAEAEARAFRHAVARARVEEPPSCPPDLGPPVVTFRRMPNVVSLPVTGPRRHDPRAAAPGSGRDHPGVPAPAAAAESSARAPRAPAEASEPTAAGSPAAESSGRRAGGRPPQAARRNTAKAT